MRHALCVDTQVKEDDYFYSEEEEDSDEEEYSDDEFGYNPFNDGFGYGALAPRLY